MSAVAYFHGGVRGLNIGDRILPPSVTGAPSTAQFGNDAARRDRVYVTTEWAAALMYAAMSPPPKGKKRAGGWIYTVEPVGELVPDPDCTMPGLSYECEAAIVAAVYYPTRAEAEMVRTALSKGWDVHVGVGAFK